MAGRGLSVIADRRRTPAAGLRCRSRVISRRPHAQQFPPTHQCTISRPDFVRIRAVRASNYGDSAVVVGLGGNSCLTPASLDISASGPYTGHKRAHCTVPCGPHSSDTGRRAVGPLGLRAFGPSGCRAVGLSGCRAVGLSGCRAVDIRPKEPQRKRPGAAHIASGPAALRPSPPTSGNPAPRLDFTAIPAVRGSNRIGSTRVFRLGGNCWPHFEEAPVVASVSVPPRSESSR